MADDLALDTLVKKASKPNKKITKASQLICVHSLPIKCLCITWAYRTSLITGAELLDRSHNRSITPVQVI
jgi:hypothetical protein